MIKNILIEQLLRRIRSANVCVRALQEISYYCTDSKQKYIYMAEGIRSTTSITQEISCYCTDSKQTKYIGHTQFNKM